VVSFAYRYQVRIRIDVLLEELWIPAVGPKANGAIVKGNRRHTRERNACVIDISHVTGTKLIQHRGAKAMDVAKLKIRSSVLEWESKPPQNGGDAGLAKLVCRTRPVYLGENPVILVEVVIQSQGGFITLEEIAGVIKPLVLRLQDSCQD
jgi:hypothetical protein